MPSSSLKKLLMVYLHCSMYHHYHTPLQQKFVTPWPSSQADVCSPSQKVSNLWGKLVSTTVFTTTCHQSCPMQLASTTVFTTTCHQSLSDARSRFKPSHSASLRTILRALTNLWKVNISFIMSVCLPVCLSSWNNLAATGWVYIKLNIWEYIQNLSIKFLFIKVSQE